MEKYHVLEVIGEGSFGRVYKGRKKYSGQVVALKFIPKVGRSEKDLLSLKREIEIMRGLKHPNIVLLLDSFETEREVVVVTEYAEGELFQILEDDGRLPESQVCQIACQLVSALYYLHSHRILHRDMKPQNILLGKSGVVKLCDFGFARAMSVSTLVLTSIKGTPLYMSPELVEEKPYDHTADLWSLGCILYELHTGVPPFYTNSIFQLVRLIVKDPVKWPDSMSPECTNFLKGLLTKDPQKRLSWPHLLEHPFVAQGVLILSHEEMDSPLTVCPSPEIQALKLQQAKEKTSPHTGEGRIIRKAREQREKRLREDAQANIQKGKSTCKENCHTDTSNPTTKSMHDCTDGEKTESTPGAQIGQISHDYAREFSVLQVEGTEVSKKEKTSQSNLGSVQLENGETDGEEEWHQMMEMLKTDHHHKLISNPEFISRLKGKLHGARIQLLSGTLEGAYQLHPALEFLGNLLTVKTDSQCYNQLVHETNLLNFLMNIIQHILDKQILMQQPWTVSILGNVMAVITLYLEKDLSCQELVQSPGNLGNIFIRILIHPDLTPLIPMAGSLLTVLAHRDISFELNCDELMRATEQALSSPVEQFLSTSEGYGLFDGLLTLLYQTLCEADNNTISQFLDCAVWHLLWLRINIELEDTEPHWICFSQTGLQTFLSLALFLFTRAPYQCLPLLANHKADYTLTLARLLIIDCMVLMGENSEEKVTSAIHDNTPFCSSSLAVMTCHLLCFPFALDVPEEALEEILHCYHSCDIVCRLLQVCLVLPLPLLDLPLALLCHLLLSDPNNSIPQFMAAAESWGFFTLLPEKKDFSNIDNKKEKMNIVNGQEPSAAKGDHTSHSETRTASTLLAYFLQSEALSSSAVELISLLSHISRCSGSSIFPLLINPFLLRKALQNKDDSVRSSTCGLLGNANPFVSSENSEDSLLLLFKDLIARLKDHSLPVRRAACRTVGNWVGLFLPNSMNELMGKESLTKDSASTELTAEHRRPISSERRNFQVLPHVKETVYPTISLENKAILSEDNASKRINNPVNFKGGRSAVQNIEKNDEECSKESRIQKVGKAGPLKITNGPVIIKEEIKRRKPSLTQKWEETLSGVVPVLLPLISDSDPVIRRHCCSTLANLGLSNILGPSLLQSDGLRLLLETACSDPQFAVRQAALGALRTLSQQDTMRQALVSLDAGEKLHAVSQYAPPQRHCKWLVSKLRPSVSA
ncbi:serine/threonine-protein kinase 36 isoform X1 [Erpetoichthys calabaricus]|uniref:serine/threonine-protein kinase 36 isoform X1 n=1 Tax=Erpetoichthys calabaricus TaxID=27687 RepID=UPI00109F5514|nr:serine/threonine-protein kinase 36 isoform X1 [Erpetoichthys calabaricus]